MPELKASFPKSRSLCLKLLLALGICVALLFTPNRARAFALLGPFEPWMQFTNGLRQPGDIGGPMDIGNGYRWNVPIVTYGFDQSFLDFFGTNGVAAVQSAIQILNDLPAASQMVLTNYRPNTTRYNYTAEKNSLIDLKSESLALLIEQLGLAQPTRYTSVLKQWSPMFLEYAFPNYSTYGSWAYPDYIVCLNFDPLTFLPSFYVDGGLYYNILEYSGGDSLIVPFPENPEQLDFTAVADNNSLFTPQVTPGVFLTGLTEDDVGGLCYLCSTNNIAYEELLPDVRGSHKCRDKLATDAWRPGVDKLTFVPQPTDKRDNRFVKYVYFYDDKYIVNGTLKTQNVERVVSKPDFLFCVKNVTNGNSAIYFDRTTAANWINNSVPNGSSEGGPGVIVPQVKITFNKLGHFTDFDNDQFDDSYRFSWSSFDGSTNAPVVYPIPREGTTPFVINMWLFSLTNFTLFSPAPNNSYEWHIRNPIGSVSLFQSSSNMTDWATMFSATNDGTSWYMFNANPLASQRFYRVVPQ